MLAPLLEALGESMFETLLSKTFAILTLQLGITWFVTVTTIDYCRRQYALGNLGLTATEKENGEIDIHLNFDEVKIFFWILLLVDIAVFLLLLFWGKESLSRGLPLFSFWSLLTGIELGLVLISVDENLGAKILAITASITAITGSYGFYTSSDLSYLGPILFIALCLLIVGNILRLIISIPRPMQRVWAFAGSVIFSLYLVYDFNRLAKANVIEENNTWPEAMSFAISIYLDIINLFLELLDAMG